jgi:hypothetical protein
VAELGVGVRLSADRNAAEVEFVVDGREVGPVRFDLQQLTDLIAVLGELRIRMVEGKPRTKMEGKEVRTIYGSGWYVQVAQIDGSLLAFDHPGFGPVAFALPRVEVTELVRLLNGHLAMPSPQSERRN